MSIKVLKKDLKLSIYTAPYLLQKDFNWLKAIFQSLYWRDGCQELNSHGIKYRVILIFD